MARQPTFHLIGGPNGAGKSKFCVDYLPAVGDPQFLNADVVAKKISPKDPNAALLEAGRLLLCQIGKSLDARESFALETTLSGRGYVRWIRRARAAGYEIVLNFLWIESVAQSIARVAARVERGGHDVPQDVILRRHALTRKNFFQLYLPLAHEWRVYDNSMGDMALLAHSVAECYDVERFDDCLMGLHKPS